MQRILKGADQDVPDVSAVLLVLSVVLLGKGEPRVDIGHSQKPEMFLILGIL